MLIVEVDGGGHVEADRGAYDERRSTFLQGCGFHVVRFWNDEVLREHAGVLEQIRLALEERLGVSAS